MTERRRYRPPRRGKHLAVWLVLALLLAGVAVEAWGGQYGLPTWAQLHRLLGLPAAPSAAAQPQQADEASVTFLDVGQGDAVLIAQGGEYCLIDAGTADAAQELCTALRQMGVERLKLLVLTHPHADHYGGMSQVQQEFAVDTLLLPPPLAPGGEEPWVQQMLRYRAGQDGTAVATAETGQAYAVGAGTLTVLQAGFTAEPDPQTEADRAENEAENNASLCLRYTLGDFAFLDTGDALFEAEDALVAAYGGALHSQLLKAGHHGSYTSTGRGLLQAASPQAVAVSCGLDNDYGHPHEQMLRRLQKQGLTPARTDLQGSLTYTWRDGTLQFEAAGKAETLLPAA